MKLVFGGAYQGKKDFARQLTENSAPVVFDCRAAEEERPAGGGTPEAKMPDFSADIICGLEQFVWDCCAEDPQQRVEAAEWMKQHQHLWQDKILIITDVSQGIVPMDARTRAFREMNGRLMLYLASEADEVWRVFCGIGKRIK
jgi:adenosyl cobinamide kinase/adenosyl cobinamide phosphate guanylyltransferase